MSTDTTPSWRAFVGCRTTAERNARGEGISVFDIDAAGRWERRHVIAVGANPSFLCLHPARDVLYAVHGDMAEVSAFAIRSGDGWLDSLGTVGSGGRNPVHLAVTRDGLWLLVANYATGNVSSLPIADDGSLDAVRHTLAFGGAPGPAADHQKGSHPHQVVFYPDAPWIYVPDKGLDCVHTVALDPGTGRLRLVVDSIFEPGAGPRHLVFDATGSHAFVVGELDSSVIACRVEPDTGRLASVTSASTVLPGRQDGNSAAGIVASADRRLIHVSNRGDDSVATFHIGADGSTLALPEWTLTGGSTPRFITLDPTGLGVIAANENSDSLCRVSFGPSIEREPSACLARTGSPVCVVFQSLKEQP